MGISDQVSYAGVFFACAYLIGLGLALIVARERASRFMLGFASSFPTHATEMLIRCSAGVALVHHSPHMRFTEAFQIFGWFLIASSFVLLLVPWRYHRHFAQIVVPPALKYSALVGVCSIVFGAFVLYALTGQTDTM